MVKRNEQYILSIPTTDRDGNNENRLKNYWKLQLLNQNIIQGIDKSMDNVESETYTVPTDLAIKNYVNNASNNFFILKRNLGEVENYYGVYSGYNDKNNTKGMTTFITVDGTLRPKVNTTGNPLVVRINGKEISFSSIATSNISDLLGSMSVTLSNNNKFDTEESKYLTEISYSNINLDNSGNKNYYIFQNNSEYSTVRVDRVNKKLIFEHFGGPFRSQWVNVAGNISNVDMISSDNLEHNLLEIRYMYIREDGSTFDVKEEPISIKSVSELSSNHPYGYNIYTEKWYSYSSQSEANIQLIGMIGVNNIGIMCSYSLPVYFSKNQKNTIRLEKISNNIISSVSGNNIIYVHDRKINTNGFKYKWNVGEKNKNKTVFLYIDYDGLAQTSVERPYRNEFGGYYLNTKGYRCVGSVFVDNNGNIGQPFDLNGTIGSSEEYSIESFAQLPLGFEGTVKVSRNGSTVSYKSNNLNSGVMVQSNSTVSYEGVINV